MDITFNCDKCGQSIVIDEAGKGAVVQCPKCSESVLVPGELVLQEEQPKRVIIGSPPAGLTRCPDCAREVSKRATTCPHCGAPLTGAMPAIDSAGTIRFNRPPTAFTPNLSRAIPVKDEEVSAVSTDFAYFLAIFLPFIGFFVGIYLLAKKQPGQGVACMAISVFSFFVWYAIMTS